MFERSKELKSAGREQREKMIRKRKRRAVEAEGKWIVGEIIGEVKGWRVRVLWKDGHQREERRKWSAEGGVASGKESPEGWGGRWRRASAETCEQNVM